MQPLSPRVLDIPRSGIRGVMDIAEKLGDVIHMEVGEPRFVAMGDVGSERHLCAPAPGIGSAKGDTRHPLGSRGLIASEAVSGCRSGTW